MTVPGSPGLTIGYLHVGPPEHGICRYGRLLAAEARSRPGLSVIEHHLVLDGEPRGHHGLLAETAEALSVADVVHTQVTVWGEGTWGPGWTAVRRLHAFRRRCRRPVVVTLHDANSFAGLGDRDVARLLVRFTIDRLLGRDVANLGPFAVAHYVLRFADLVLILLKTERQYLERLYPKARLHHIPLYLEVQPPATADARPGSATKTIIVPGFIFKGKGHELMIEAMPALPDVKVAFVGGQNLGAAGADHSARLMQAAREKGVADRLSITGFLPEDEYRRYLSLTDLAVCPFDGTKSGSSSIAALLGAGCPILASEVPAIGEYNDLVPGVIPTFAPYTAKALAAAVRQALARPRASYLSRFATLQQALSLPRVFDRHLDLYAQLAGRPLA